MHRNINKYRKNPLPSHQASQDFQEIQALPTVKGQDLQFRNSDVNVFINNITISNKEDSFTHYWEQKQVKGVSSTMTLYCP